RVVMIKLADRTHNMRTLSALPREKQRRIARETLDIYAPLANRLGIWQIKWELEDLSFRYLDPALYKNIAKMLDERRVDREQYIKEVIEILQEALSRAGIKFEISGRPKHIFSIWYKMQRKNIDYHQVYDVRGIRILTNEISGCYAALGIVHSLWQYIPGEFDDYIATPKENNYQSIHTAVIGPRGKTVEIQIRTHEMHKNNELGVAAHWRYKEGSTEDQVFDEKISWLRQLMEWKDEISDASDFVDQLKSDIFEDRIYVFTPKGKVIDLPKGSTPLDFAYQIHTEVGHHCRGAKVNGNMVPLTYQLKTGQQVDVLTVKNATPSRDWINPHRGYLKTNRAKNKVQHWFKQQDHEKNVVEGRNTLEKELKRLGLASVNFSTLATKYKFDDIDEFYGAIARGDIKTAHVINAAQQLVEPQVKQEIDKFTLQKPVSSENKQGDIQIQGIGNLLTNIANCCKPVPGDEIGGYITRGRGVTIHRSDCANMLRYSVQCPERVIAVNWGGDADNTYPVDVQIVAFDRQGLLRDITSILANEKINLIAANTISDKKDHRATMRLTLEISNISRLSKVVDKIDQLPNVIEVTRLAH
ncbi:MAG: GTP diphosphokinase, partial [Gammaproteobacteria bacterium]